MAVTSTSQLPEITKHIHSAQKVYPTQAANVTVTDGSDPWVLGAFAEIVPVSTITSNFCITGVNIEGGDADIFELVLYYGASNTECARVRTGDVTTTIPVSTIIIPANSKIRAKTASKFGSDTSIFVSINYVLHV